LKKEIVQTELRFSKSSKQGLLCDSDGRPSHAGEFVYGVSNIYISGYIGWSGRSYLQDTKITDQPNNSDTLTDVPVVLGMISVSCLWSFAAWKELVSRDLLLSGQEVIVSTR
jgi:photosystem I subunit 3